jgi:hypothetical protein
MLSYIPYVSLYTDTHHVLYGLYAHYITRNRTQLHGTFRQTKTNSNMQDHFIFRD